MITGSQKKPPLGLSEASDRVAHTALRTVLEQTGAAESVCQEQRTRPAAYTIAEFCEAFRISKAHLHNLRRRGEGPAVFRAGRRTLVARASAESWVRRMEALAGATTRGEKRP
jgi:Helix-turn-helix domain